MFFFRNILNRGMDKLRRSFRKSFSRGARSSRLTTNQQNSMEIPIASTSGGSSKNSFQQDEAAVRGGTCQFQVKYLGSCEVFEPRGMAVCENALRHLRASYSPHSSPFQPFRKESDQPSLFCMFLETPSALWTKNIAGAWFSTKLSRKSPFVLPTAVTTKGSLIYAEMEQQEGGCVTDSKQLRTV